ncbi:hypothetical protein Spith_1562 [Spirochaeta thermophila DSM 6578]|uniref:CBM11 domain-containing protein n=1 Tax=Winmispira thermophila (strain ATCC 700085 / DSM 6578 / Z-1203) TaxID=869211 RepID=G0GAS7_WINT7|nr:hypothetical protein [Spirochaeta thermophila]AEJ61823.1 hypothetical protein Spith_1562 [Spirochaeta thermophila DSM 6578]
MKHERFFLLVVGVSLLLLGACSNPAGSEEKQDTTTTLTSEQVSMWSIEPGSGNEDQPTENYSVAPDVENVNPNGGGIGCMKVTFSSNPWAMTELYAPIPDDDYSGYDGVAFDIKIDYSENFCVIVRGDNTSVGEQQHWKYENYVYYGGTPDTWQTVQFAFADFTDPGWATSGSNVDATIYDFFSNPDTVVTQLNINPILNLGDSEAGEAEDTPITFYIDNIRLYDADGVLEDLVLFDFDDVQEQ